MPCLLSSLNNVRLVFGSHLNYNQKNMKNIAKIILPLGLGMLFLGVGCNNQNNNKAVGVVPFDYPVLQQTSAKVGEYVLTTERYLLDVQPREAEKNVFVFFTFKMVEPGMGESVVNNDRFSNLTLPNSMIIPIPSGQKAKPGDVVLTWWQSGSGMQRALVVGGTETEPEVYYLDRDILPDEKPEKLKPDSFLVLKDGPNPGVSAACKQGSDLGYYVLVNVTAEKYLVTSWTGKVRSFFKNECQLIPVDYRGFKIGDKVWAPIFGAYQLVTIVAIDNTTGRFTVSFKEGKMEYRPSATFSSLITDLKL